MIGIVDYGLGNIKSLTNWLTMAFDQVVLSDDPNILRQANLLVLPGVGAFGDAVSKLSKSGLDDFLKDQVNKGKPLVGICLGLQLLYETSYEGGTYRGLGILKGEVKPFDASQLKVPHMGWNQLVSKECRWQDKYVYFVHSYYIEGQEGLVAYADYGVRVPGIVRKDNVLGFQFHPEKSSQVGLDMLVMIKELRDDYLSSDRYP